MAFYNNVIAGAAGAGAGAGAADFNIERSLRFNSGDSSHLTRTPSSAGNRRIWTWSGWVKKSTVTSNTTFFSAGSDGSNRSHFMFDGTTHALRFFDLPESVGLITNALFRDTQAWYHFVIAVNTTLNTTADRVKLYVNGEQLTSFSSSSYPGYNAQLQVNRNAEHRIGSGIAYGEYFNGYIAEVNFVDGQQLAPTDFGAFDSTTGVWNPKRFTGSYAGNSYRLDFSDASSDAALGTDRSGNNNTWTVNNLTSGGELADNGFDHFVYTGTGSDQSFTNLKFQPDFLWFKSLTRVDSHGLYDVIRGRASNLYADLNNGENISAVGSDLKSFDSNGFTLGGVQQTALNRNSEDYIVWAWKAGGSPSTNTDGNINSSVSVSTAYGFSVVKYTGDGATNGSVGHGLGSTPKMVIVKRIDGSNDWKVRHTSLGSTEMMSLNESYAAGVASWNGETSSVFYPARSGDTYNNVSNANYIAYCWSEVSGFSKFGSYAGSSSSVTITTGFKPAYIIIKSNDTAGQEWIIKSAVRGTNLYVMAENSNAESTGREVTFNDNGFTASPGSGATNYSGRNYVYAAFAEGSSAEIDSLIESPISYQASSGNNGGNYATWSPLAAQTSGSITLSNGNLDTTCGSTRTSCMSTFPLTGKTYWEVVFGAGANNSFGMTEATGFNTVANNNSGLKYVGYQSYSYGWQQTEGRLYNASNNLSSSPGAYSNGDVVGWAYDADNNTLKLYKNGSLQHTQTGIADAQYFPALTHSDNGATASVNFGQRPFAYTPPTGHVSLCTQNLDASAYASIADPSTAFDAVAYSGSGAAKSISLGFSPDLVWTKQRTGTEWHYLIDTVRGNTKALFSNANNSDFTTNAQVLTAFNSDGYSLGSDSAVNSSSHDYISWSWDAGSSTVSNTNGNFTTNVRANQSAGFSIVKAPSMTIGTKTLGHGLNATPDMVWVKRSSGGTEDWYVFHSALGTGKQCRLNGSGAVENTTSFGTVNSTVVSYDPNTGDHMAYCFTAVEGFSAFGSYTGNGSADGPFIYTGFRVRWLLQKRTDSSGSWAIKDAAREPFNVVDTRLYADSTSADMTQSSFHEVDFLSNGFKVRSPGGSEDNANNGTFIYAAFAESPLKYARAR